MNTFDFIDEYIKNIDYKEISNGFDLTMPFRFFNDETIITLHLQKNESGYFDIDDKGNTLRYLNNIDVKIENYKDKIFVSSTI